MGYGARGSFLLKVFCAAYAIRLRCKMRHLQSFLRMKTSVLRMILKLSKPFVAIGLTGTSGSASMGVQKGTTMRVLPDGTIDFDPTNPRELEALAAVRAVLASQHHAPAMVALAAPPVSAPSTVVSDVQAPRQKPSNDALVARLQALPLRIAFLKALKAAGSITITRMATEIADGRPSTVSGIASGITKVCNAMEIPRTALVKARRDADGVMTYTAGRLLAQLDLDREVSEED